VLPGIVLLAALFAALARFVNAGHTASFDRYIFLLFRRGDDPAITIGRTWLKEAEASSGAERRWVSLGVVSLPSGSRDRLSN
jgi:hypothetical protein